MNGKWVVIHLGPVDGYGVAVHRVSMLELFCRGMTMQNAIDICDTLNKAGRALPPRRD
jgi:hypothetical protein